MNVRYFIVSLLLLIFIYSCTVSIDGAPCNPELNNCPSGQYCTSDGVCKRGTPEVRDVTEVSDISVKDVNNDIPDGLTETFEDIIDVLSDTEDSGNDVKYDGGCVDECNISICKDNNMLLGCRDWDNDGCKEYKEVDCGGGSECKNNICICKSPYQDCNNDISDGCETDTNTNSERCGSCSNNCGQNSACNAGICGCKDGFDNCDGKWSNGCEVNLAEDLKNCGACNKDCGPNTYCADMKCVCKTDYADCNQNEPGCETYLLSITSCGTTCEDIRNCGLNSVCNQGSCGCKSGYKDCNSDLSDGCETNILADINNCGYCKNECKPFNVNNPLCKNGLCDYDFCNEFFYDKDLKRDNGCEYWTNFPKRYDNNMAKDEASIILYDEEGMLIGGNTVNNQLWLMKVDKYGEIIWQKIIQLKGISKFRKGISVTNDSGKPEGFLLTGTLQNGERIDIFALRIDLKGNVIFAKSYSRQLPNVNKFDVYAVMYIRSENTFVIVGESSGTPLFLAIKEDGNSPLAKYYIEDSGGSFNNAIGFFTDIEILPTYDDSLYITGVYLGIGGRKAVSAVNLKYSGDVRNFYRISSQIDLTGFAMTPSIGIVSNEQFFIFGEAGIRGIALNALAMKYDFASKKLENAFIISGKDLSSNQVGLSFRNVRTINKNGPVNLVGGSYLFLKNASVVSNALVALIEQNLSVSKMKAVKNTDVEEVIDMIFSDSFVFISPTTFNNNLDILAVKMNSDLEIKGASCNKSFLSDVSFTGQSLVNPSVESVSVKVFEIGDLKVQEVLNNQMEATGSASNVCNKP